MSQESLSALLDGECTEAQLEALLQELERSPELKASWRRQCIARDSLRGQSLKTRPLDLSAGVMAAIAAEPVSAKVVPIRARRQPRPLWQSVTGLSMAAGLAAVAVALGVNYGRLPGAADTAGAALQASAAAQLQPVAYTQNVAADEDLRNYLIEHSNTLADRGVGGALSYARFAAHTGEAYAQPVNLSVSGPQP